MLLLFRNSDIDNLSPWESLMANMGDPIFWAKIVVLVGLAPFWWPALRAMFEEVQTSLRGEGGLFTRRWTPRQLGKIEARWAEHGEPLTHQPHETGKGSGGRGGPRPARSPAPGAVRGGGIRAARRRGF